MSKDLDQVVLVVESIKPILKNINSRFSTVNDKSLGVGQTWQDVTASRSSGVIYTNSTGKPIAVFVECQSGTFDDNAALVRVNSGSSWVTVGFESGSSAIPISFIVPSGHQYILNGLTFYFWTELR